MLQGYIIEVSSFHIYFITTYINYLNSLSSIRSAIDLSNLLGTRNSAIAAVDQTVSQIVFNLEYT